MGFIRRISVGLGISTLPSASTKPSAQKKPSLIRGASSSLKIYSHGKELEYDRETSFRFDRGASDLGAPGEIASRTSRDLLSFVRTGSSMDAIVEDEEHGIPSSDIRSMSEDSLQLGTPTFEKRGSLIPPSSSTRGSINPTVLCVTLDEFEKQFRDWYGDSLH